MNPGAMLRHLSFHDAPASLSCCTKILEGVGSSGSGEGFS